MYSIEETEAAIKAATTIQKEWVSIILKELRDDPVLAEMLDNQEIAEISIAPPTLPHLQQQDRQQETVRLTADALATTVIDQYSRMSCDDMRLMFGELTANEIRTVRAVLQAIIRDINNEQDKESNR